VKEREWERKQSARSFWDLYRLADPSDHR